MGRFILSALAIVGISGAALATMLRTSPIAFWSGCALATCVGWALVWIGGIAYERCKGGYVKLLDLEYDDKTGYFILTIKNLGRVGISPRLMLLGIEGKNSVIRSSIQIDISDLDTRNKGRKTLPMQGALMRIPLFQYSLERNNGDRMLLCLTGPGRTVPVVVPCTRPRGPLTVRLAGDCGGDALGNIAPRSFVLAPRKTSDEYDVIRPSIWTWLRPALPSA